MAVALPGVGRLSWRLPRFTRLHAVRTIAVILTVAGATVGCYFWLLGWHRRTATGVDAYLDSPYRGWQVGLLVGLLGLLALGSGWLRRPIAGSLVIAAALTTCWTLDASLNVHGDRNWPIGTTLVAWASLGGSLVLAGGVAEVRRMIDERAEAARLAELAAAQAAAA
ncbi:hypothetical protein, partial [Jatrophihabitans sp.]|uniref:hypothetical protein n=1 Tax=Jatrophihabitans sp. TaxID=1932789 RepID=UPI0030C6C53B|nr:hypothetical protein [Jatrophihabitans sp.]